MLNRRNIMSGLAITGLGFLPLGLQAAVADQIASLAKKVQPKVVAWRRDIHQHPELANREFRTAKLVALELKRLGLDVRENIAVTGVVGVLKGAKSGRVVALRADMDALPVLEKTGEPFASKEIGEFEGATVPITHACGHDCHVAMLLGAAEVLAQIKSEIKGTIVFIFQPAEEGPPSGEDGGAPMMVAQGVLDNPKVQSIFGIHVWPGKTGQISYRPKGFMAAADRIEIKLKGSQTHGALPWKGIDMTALASDIVGALNQIASRQLDITAEPTVITIATMHGGARYNIIPEDFTLGGTLRTFSKERRADVMKRIERAVAGICQSYGAQGEVKFTSSGALTYNDEKLSHDLLPSLIKAAGASDQVNAMATAITGAEDFSAYQEKIPGVYCFLGVSRPDQDPQTAPPNHSPYFNAYEPALEVGVRAHVMASLAMLERKL